jgi:hypothetical protein
LSDEKTLDVSDAMKVSHRIFDIAVDALQSQLKKQLDHLSHATARPAWTPKVAPESLFEVPPAHIQWVPPVPMGAHLSAGR